MNVLSASLQPELWRTKKPCKHESTGCPRGHHGDSEVAWLLNWHLCLSWMCCVLVCWALSPELSKWKNHANGCSQGVWGVILVVERWVKVDWVFVADRAGHCQSTWEQKKTNKLWFKGNEVIMKGTTSPRVVFTSFTTPYEVPAKAGTCHKTKWKNYIMRVPDPTVSPQCCQSSLWHLDWILAADVARCQGVMGVVVVVRGEVVSQT